MELRRWVSRLFQVGPPTAWGIAPAAALASLVLLWAWQLYATWGAWGDLTIDSGHEMYVPAVLAQGKTLYRDVWFMYGPASPYFNSYLFRVFGIQLNVLYWAGSLSALGAAIFLFLIGMRLSAWPVGWAAALVQIVEAFDRSLFCFPLPYSFAAVYGCVLGCLFLWVAIIASRSPNWLWMLAAGSLAAIEVLIKPEFGMAAYATIGLLLLVRGLRESQRFIRRDIVALLPGLAFCAIVIYWMVSLAGVEFITQENIVSWPTSYFMKNFGQMWLAKNGFTVSASAIRDAGIRALFPAGVLLELYCLLAWKRRGRLAWLVRLVLLPGALAFYAIVQALGFVDLLIALVLPRDMVLYVAVAAAVGWWSFWRQPAQERDPSVPLLLSFSALLAFRILMRMRPGGYPIYYNGPVIFCYLLLARAALPKATSSREAVYLRDFLLCVLPALVIAAGVGHFTKAPDVVPLNTGRGTVRVSKEMAENYQVAITFMKEKAAAGEVVLSVPEDTSLYFLSETSCPIRLFSFTPGVLAPGRMTDDTIREIERKHVRYLLWSNRTFEDFGTPIFGTDFDREIGDYFRSRYRRLGPLTAAHEWRADVWERRPDATFR
jgi:hypothetical protein